MFNEFIGIIRNTKSIFKTSFYDLSEFKDKEHKLKTAKKRDIHLNEFLKLKQKPFAYKLNSNAINEFAKSVLLESLLDIKQVIATSNNDRFVRFGWEIELKKFGKNLYQKPR